MRRIYFAAFLYMILLTSVLGACEYYGLMTISFMVSCVVFNLLRLEYER